MSEGHGFLSPANFQWVCSLISPKLSKDCAKLQIEKNVKELEDYVRSM